MGRKKGRRKAPFKLQLKRDTILSIVGVVLFVVAGLILVSFSDQGVILQYINLQLVKGFGIPSLVLPFLFISGGLMVSQAKFRFAKPNVFFGGILLFISILGLLQGGSVGTSLFTNLAVLVTGIGSGIIFFAIGIVGLMIMLEIALDEILQYLSSLLSKLGKSKPAIGSVTPKFGGGDFKIKGADQQLDIEDVEHTEKPVKVNPQPVIAAAAEKKASGGSAEDFEKSIITSSNKSKAWELPPLELLSLSGGAKAERGDIKKNASVIESTLESFGIKARVAEVNCGPAVTQYALEISLGTKLSKITALQNDLALNLAAPTGQIRIEAPIPGRSLVGIEIPNISPEMVTLRSMLRSKSLKGQKSKLMVALGLNVAGEPISADIGKMPHVLIAGATGSGKSVALNTFIASILFRASPDEVKFILVDPKRVELTGYNDIPHLLTPVIVEPDKVVSALKWAVTEMNQRYKTFAEVGVRNISSYNELSGFQAVPYIVIIIDELADIMLFAPKDVEEAITRLAQMARAVGIHLVLATQRPSVDILTGLIKANVPTRVAFNVASMVDSRVIIDSPGAEKLLGRGDMLYIPPGQSKPTRVQGTYVSDNEINALIDYLKNSGFDPQYTEEITSKFVGGGNKITGATGNALEDVDEKFEEAVRLVVQYNRASASLLQRSLSVGYARAARIMDQLEQAGIVSPSDGSSKPRDILIASADEFFAAQSPEA